MYLQFTNKNDNILKSFGEWVVTDNSNIERKKKNCLSFDLIKWKSKNKNILWYSKQIKVTEGVALKRKKITIL